MKFTDLAAHIAKAQFLPCYVLSGDDEYLIKKALDMFSGIIELAELNLSVIEDGAKEDAAAVAAVTLPFVSQYRLVIASTRFLPSLTDYFKQPSPTSIIVLRAEKGFKPTKNVEVVDCSRLSVDILKASIAAECKKNNASITAEAAVLVTEYCRRYMGRIRGELHKLIAYKKDGAITADDVRVMVRPDPEYRVFELSDAIVKKDGTKALTLLEDMLTEGYGAAVKVFGLLYSHFKRLMAVALDPANAPQYLEINGYAVTAAINQSKAFSKLRLKGILDKLHRLDLGLKTGEVSDKVGLTTFVIEAISQVN